ncbi:hypothetical protein P872_02125 [Rhodonellum psychrophilum GCM71 = DSM 17998]|uniref:Uncharacterized protein n=1 Tax=Rhodonellum psychrophilum GCM71 = DSM 17998 TaxID=1123057 RepID=U5C6N9_9BACT|nr:hypothetical protein P872_02125 [Rhodonellum psychrophilum GCM71 = DSM 17998]
MDFHIFCNFEKGQNRRWFLPFFSQMMGSVSQRPLNKVPSGIGN